MEELPGADAGGRKIPGMQVFTILYLLLFIVLPIALISLFIGLIAWNLRAQDQLEEESLGASMSLEKEV
jgi:hypothetical protein